MTESHKWGSVADIADAYHVTVKYVRNLASQHKWRRIRFGGRVYYHWDDAGNHLGK